MTPGRGRSRSALRRRLGAAVLLLGLPAAAGARAPALVDDELEIRCLALTIYFEARGEPDLGRIAVAEVVLNRAADGRFPRRLCDVVFQDEGSADPDCQFSWTCDGLSDRPTDTAAWEASVALARRAYRGILADPTGGALWYHADSVAPQWTDALGPGLRIGRHIFYREPAGGAQPGLAPAWHARSAPPAARPDLSFGATVRQIAEALRALAPGPNISVLVYSQRPEERLVRIDRVFYREGDRLADGATVEAINPDGVVLRRGGRRVTLAL